MKLMFDRMKTQCDMDVLPLLGSQPKTVAIMRGVYPRSRLRTMLRRAESLLGSNP